jgi:hypothetical protein
MSRLADSVVDFFVSHTSLDQRGPTGSTTLDAGSRETPGELGSLTGG